MNDIMKELNGMSKEDLIKLKDTIEFLLTMKDGSINIREDVTTFYKVLSKKLLDYEGIECEDMYLLAYKKPKFIKKLNETEQKIVKFFSNECGKKTLNIHEKIKYYGFYIYCVLLTLTHYEIPISLTTFLNYANKIHQVIEFCFPGYIESGLLSNVIDLVNNKKHGGIGHG